MERVLYVIVLLVGVYIVDHYAFGGRISAETAMAVNNFAQQADYKVKDLLRPLSR